ncbi:histidine phosphatase family protein [Lachnospiraceae bacterium LCP25S3_G4]
MKIVMIRHFQTYGNVQRKYIGVTDEPLERSCLPIKKGNLCGEKTYPIVPLVVVSPMLRCRQTADYIYPNVKQYVVEGLKECHFGTFENHNYEELKNDKMYQQWLSSNGAMAFPKGEDVKSFKKRCRTGFEQAISYLIDHNIEEAAFVVHGGTIMAIMESYGYPKKKFYERQVGNGCGFVLTIDVKKWKLGEKIAVEEYKL